MKDQLILRESGTTYILDDREVTEEEYRARYPLPPSDGDFQNVLHGEWRDHYSDALAVHPKQIKKAEKEAKERGVPTEFEPEFGRPKFNSREHRRQYMRAFGYHDNNSFTGY